MRVLATRPVAKAPQFIVVRPSDEVAEEAEMDAAAKRQVQKERRYRQLRKQQFEEGDNPADDFPVDPLFPEVEGYDARLVERDSQELARLARQTLAILKKNEVILERIRKRQERPFSSAFDEPGTPAQKGQGPSPAKRMTPGSADGDQQVIDAVIGDMISKMYAQSPALRSLGPAEAAEIIGQLFEYKEPEKSQLINTYIDAAIEDAAFVKDMANVQVKDMANVQVNDQKQQQQQPSKQQENVPIGCFAPSCVNPVAHRCSECKSAYYCSRACQVRDWTDGGHAEQCVPKIK